MRIAFYAPLKAPDHPVPSGDRTMGRLLLKALREHHTVEVVSPLRSFLAEPDRGLQDAILRRADAETERLGAGWRADQSTRPDVWFTYHNHYKAPDLLGPHLSRHLGVPYVLAEASHAAKRAAQWSGWHIAAEAASRTADLHFCFTQRDRTGLAALLGSTASLVDLPPFIDVDEGPLPTAENRTGPVEIVTVAMMRVGDKFDSYALLAEALASLGALDWHLTVIGDGPAAASVKARFAGISDGRIAWKGMLDPSDVPDALAQGDIFAWPGFGEAFGLSYLEAQCAGLPVVALGTAGVPSVVLHGETGLLTEANVVAYSDGLSRLIRDPEMRRAMGQAATRFVRQTRTRAMATRVLDAGLCRAAMAKANS